MAGWDYEILGGEAVKNAVIAVLMPHRDEHDYRMWRIWWENHIQKLQGTIWFEQRGFSLTTNRTRLVQMALEHKEVTHIFFLDDDVVCPENILPVLLSLKLPIACGLYMAKKRREERGLGAWIKVAEGKYASIDRQQAGRFVEVDVTGLGCALIERSIFEKVLPPWFVWDPPPALSEDFFFFEKVSKVLGIKPIIDMEMACRHIGVFVVDIDGNFTTPEM